MADKGDELRNPYAPSREALIDRQIREAQEAGAFHDLPHQGKPLPLEDDSAAGEWALAHRMLKNANFAPPWIEADKEARALLARREAILERASRSSAITRRVDRDELTGVVKAANEAIRRVNDGAPTPRQQRRLLDLEVELAALDRIHAGEA